MQFRLSTDGLQAMGATPLQLALRQIANPLGVPTAGTSMSILKQSIKKVVDAAAAKTAADNQRFDAQVAKMKAEKKVKDDLQLKLQTAIELSNAARAAMKQGKTLNATDAAAAAAKAKQILASRPKPTSFRDAAMDAVKPFADAAKTTALVSQALKTGQLPPAGSDAERILNDMAAAGAIPEDSPLAKTLPAAAGLSMASFFSAEAMKKPSFWIGTAAFVGMIGFLSHHNGGPKKKKRK